MTDRHVHAVDSASSARTTEAAAAGLPDLEPHRPSPDPHRPGHATPEPAGADLPPSDLPPSDLPGPEPYGLELPRVPVDLAAFCELHRPRYLSYARVWFREPGRAAEVVRRAMLDLAPVWPELLGSPNLTAAAWQIVRDSVADQHALASPDGLRPGPADEDLAILHYVVGLATPEIADVVGGDTANITSQLRHTHRREPARPATER